MKYLIYFLLFSTVVFSQNYQYAIEEASSIKLPSAPTDLLASDITEVSVVLSWTAAANNSSIKEYGIYSNSVLVAKSVGAETTYKITGLDPGTSYTFTVRSIDANNKISGDSNLATFATNTIIGNPILDPPTRLIASEITETSVVLSWTAPANNSSITEYGIYSKNILVATSNGSETSYKITGLLPETAYSFTIKAIGKEGTLSSDSNSKTVITNKVADEPLLAAPTNLVASEITESSVVLSWTIPINNSSIKEYGIYSKTILVATAVGIGNIYKITGLIPETEYILTVRSVDNGGLSSVDSNSIQFTTAKIGEPTGLIASEITETSVILNWTAPTNNASVTGYGIYSKNILLSKSGGIATTYKVTGLIPETVYNLTVRSIDNAGRLSIDSNIATFTTDKLATGVNNQLEEIEYFKAHLLPIAQKGTLQKALDTYGSVRLEQGDYSGVDIVMKSNQRLYGYPTMTQVSNITIAAGSTNVHLQDLFPSGKNVTFQAGGVISNCTLKTIKWATIKATNAMVENNLFINIMSAIQFDCSSSGYFRNNKFIKHQVHGVSDMLVMKGNSATPSYGNVHLHSNFLTPAGDATDIDNLRSITFVGLDSEAWNFSGTGKKPMLYMQNMGDVKITDFGGGNSYSTVQTPTFNIDANNLFFLNKYIQGEGRSGAPTVAAKTNVLYFAGEHDDFIRGAGSVTGFDLKAHFHGTGLDKDVTLNGKIQTSSITNATAITSSILGTQHTPFARTTWEKLPDPLGANWQTDRTGKTDSTSFIQNLLNSKGIAELPEGIFYISSTLKMIVDGTKGIVGAGTGKTVIVGLRDDFPLITLAESSQGDNDFILSNLTLQGGSSGVFAPDEMDLIAFTNLKYVVFRNQKYGIHLYRIFGLDNCFFDSVSFVDCTVGFFQDPHPVYTFENAGYVDKVVFYNGQYLNCGTAVSMKATRADNLNAWINCKFDGNSLAFDISGNNFPIVANCDFTNHRGPNIIRDSPLAMYNCNFYNNSTTDAIIRAQGSYMEGCNLSDAVPVFSSTVHYLMNNYILNSTIKGNVTRTYGLTQAVFVNSNLIANPLLSKMLVNVKDNVPNVLINVEPKPYPQFLVTQ